MDFYLTVKTRSYDADRLKTWLKQCKTKYTISKNLEQTIYWDGKERSYVDDFNVEESISFVTNNIDDLYKLLNEGHSVMVKRKF
jgi:hypothetical protein